MSTEEVKGIHSRHKREKYEVDVKKKEEFDVNQEDDEDFAGPSLDLFQREESKPDPLEEIVKKSLYADGEGRQRKENDILKKV